MQASTHGDWQRRIVRLCGTGALACAMAMGVSPVLAATHDDLAPDGTAYRWAHLIFAESNAAPVEEPRLNDGNSFEDVDLSGGESEPDPRFEAAGVRWVTPRITSEFQFVHGSWSSSGDGAFCSQVQVQILIPGTEDGWFRPTGWTLAPAYAFNSPSNEGVTYKFSGPPLAVSGVRVVGRLRCSFESSWWTNVRELHAFGPAESWSLWSTTTVPGLIDSGDPAPVTVGTRFRSDVNGYLVGARFYKAPANTNNGTERKVALWSADGSPRGVARLPRETSSGWQAAYFISAVPVRANEELIIAYTTPLGHYSVTSGYFAASEHVNGPLHAPRDVAPGNGVFLYGPGDGFGFPVNSWQSSNYWVDVIFVPERPVTPPADMTPPSVPTAVSALAAGATAVNVSWAASSDDVGIAKYRIFRDVSSTAIADAVGTSFRDFAVAPATTYRYQVQALDATGNASALSEAATVTTGSGTASSNCILAPSVCGYPDETTVGVPPGTALRQINEAYTTTHDGEVIEGVEIRDTLVVKHNNVTVRNSRIHGGPDFTVILNDAKTGLLVDHCDLGHDLDVGPVKASYFGAGATITNNVFHNFHDAAIIPDVDTLIENNYFAHFRARPDGGDHLDGIQSADNSTTVNLTIRHNTFQMRSDVPIVDPLAGPNAAIHIAGSNNRNIIIDNNLIGGGGSFWVLRVDDVTGVITNNRFDRDFPEGGGAILGGDLMTIRGNVYDDDNQPLPENGD